MYPQVNIDEEIIKIKTLTVGGRRMTKSVFNQVISLSPFDSELTFTGDKVIGYVYEQQSRWLLFIKDGQLRKYILDNILQLINVGKSTKYKDFQSLADRLRFGHLQTNFDHEDDWNKERKFANESYSEETWGKILNRIDKAKSFIAFLDDRQIFISA
jgi:hypothetical protein